jgi:3-deoxy-D-manno-octulosonate 8-phosphate phosphatase (KDO 8-P phosphatase)
MSTPITADLRARAARVRLLIFDVDGVLTGGELFYGDDGQEYKAFHSRDGHGIKMLHDNGLTTAIITGRQSRVVEHRVRNLGIGHVYQGQHDKREGYASLLATLGLEPAETAYLGDDVVDLPVMLRVGLALAVADAHPLVKQHAHWITPQPGGRGAARDACELLLDAHGLLEASWQKYLS